MKKWVSFVALLAISSFALNKDGLQGVHLTNSAQTMGHSKFGIGFLGDVTKDGSVVQDQGGYNITQTWHAGLSDSSTQQGALSNFTGASLYPFMSIGLGEFFDFSLAMPIYYESWTVKPKDGSTGSAAMPIDGLTKTGMGDLRINAKFRAPIPQDEYVIDIGLLMGGTVNTHSETGLWVRESEYLGTTNVAQETNPFGMNQSSWKVAFLSTIDLRRLNEPMPLLLHANVGYRQAMADYSPVLYYSGAAEIYLMNFFSLFGELYKEAPSKAPANMIDVFEITAGGTIHTNVGIEIYVAAHSNMGSDSKYATNLVTQKTDDRTIQFNGRTLPALYAMVGFTWSGYLISPDIDQDGVPDKDDFCPDIPQGASGKNGCPDPDIDRDGVCNSWVSEHALSDKFADVCHGSDKCPSTAQGVGGKDGCPALDADGDGIADDIDLCPNIPQGIGGKEGCPDPDPDKDQICDAWVTELDLTENFASVCHDLDKCPMTPEGVNGKDGCPAKDADGDGILDDQDLCPHIAQGINGKFGCPDPDADHDGVCDGWVTDLSLQEKFASVCKGVDNCPVVPQGINGKDGCPLIDSDGDGIADDQDVCPRIPQGINGKMGCPDPDPDKDSICDPWVTDMALTEKFAAVCHGSDKCPVVPGIGSQDGCPLKDTDGDGIPDALDLCPAVPQGINGKLGCPDVDPDKDGFCDQWVTDRGLSEKFAATCKGIDKCPTIPGGVNSKDGCVGVKPIEDNVILDGVNFKTGTTELTFESKKVLDKIIEQLVYYPDVSVEIRGHTDNVGKRASNQKLSEGRAKAVVDYFASKGVNMKRLAFAGFADTQPLEDNKTAAGRAKNRRIEMYRTK